MDFFNFAENIPLSLLYGLQYGLSMSYNLFLFYCVCNTVAPKTTNAFVFDLALFGLEVYTIAELKVKKTIRHTKETIINRYPFLSITYLHEYINREFYPKENKTSNTIIALNTDGQIIDNSNMNLKKNDDISCLIIKDTSSLYIRVFDTPASGCTYSDLQHDIQKSFDETKLSYKFLACTIDNDNTNQSWSINLSNETEYNFYTLGNIIFTNTFLKYFVNNYLFNCSTSNATSRQELLDAITEGNYTIKIIDNKANLITWKGSNKYILLSENGPEVIDDNNQCVDTNEEIALSNINDNQNQNQND